MPYFMTNLEMRDKKPEILDQPGVAVATHRQALDGLARINWASCSDRILWNPIRRLAEETRQPLRVLDLASGGGDIPIRLQRRAKRAGLPIAFTGTDFSQTAVDYARLKARQHKTDVDFFCLDVINTPLPTGYDVITSSLFLHHLEMDQAIDLLRRMGQASRSMILINDLNRCVLGYLLAWGGTHVLSASSIVWHDGPQSVRAAFTIAEARNLAEQAGLQGASVDWRWPFRFLIQWRRPT